MNTMVFPVIRTDLIREALESFWQFSDPEEHRVIVIDQSRTGLPDFVAEQLAHMQIRVYRNLGFAKAANTGIRLADTEYVTICNDDVMFFDERWWSGLLNAFKKAPDAVGMNPSCPRLTFGITGVTRSNPRHIADIENREMCKKEGVFDLLVKETPFQGFINGCAMWCICFSMPRLREAGLLGENLQLFDENFYPGAGEDYDLLGRAAKAERKIMATHLSWIWHDWGMSKDEKTHDGMAQILDRPAWNRLGDLWLGGFDAWGRCPDRIPEVHVEPL
jgi:GT2 family glycosyltransferase